MNDFTFTGRERTTFIGMILVGVVCLAATYIMGDPSELAGQHTRFWSNLLHNSVFFTGIAFIALFMLSAFITAYAGWYTVMKRVWEAFSLFLIVGLGLMGFLAVATYLGWHHLYHWNMDGVLDPNNKELYDEILVGKASFLNKNWYTFGTLIIVGIWTFFAIRLRALSVGEDTNGGKNKFGTHYSIRWWAAAFMPIAAFSSAALIWQWVMSIDSHWYSTMFAWYSTASWFVAMLALTILLLIYLKSRGYYEKVTAEHLHDIGKFLFAFSIFWTYLWFSQYMLIWYANVGEETIYFHTRVHEYPVLFYGNLVVNFVLPFLILMRNDTKRKYGTLVFVSVLVFIGHWWDYFYMIKPGVLHTAHEVHHHGHSHGDGGHHDHAHDKVSDAAHHAGEHAHEAGHAAAGHAHDAAHGAGDHAADAGHHAAEFLSGFTLPGFLELGTMIGFLGLFLLFVFSRLGSASLEPVNDPYYEESLNHHT